MKQFFKPLGIILFIGIIFLSNTSFYYETYQYRGYIPIFMERNHLDQSVFYQPTGRELVNPGKIYHKDPYILINERYKGIHIINNADPANPINQAFIIAPGCIDMAMKGNILYLDNAVDLVAFDLDTKKVTKRIKDILPEPKSPNNDTYYGYDRRENYIVVGWELKK